jgi:LacI family gluconate utilization system Gnt-I transcriptional repressor
VDELGYVPNRAARALASSQSKVIAVLVPSLSNAVFTEVLAGIQDALDADDYQILIGNTRYSDREEKAHRHLPAVQSRRHAAVGPDPQPARAANPGRQRMPVVSMMDMSTDPERLSVGFSQFQAGHAMTRYLLDKGHKRIGFIGAQLDERTLRRAEGYRKAMQEAGRADVKLEVMVASRPPSRWAPNCWAACWRRRPIATPSSAATTTWRTAPSTNASGAVLPCRRSWPSAASTTCRPRHG